MVTWHELAYFGEITLEGKATEKIFRNDSYVETQGVPFPDFI